MIIGQWYYTYVYNQPAKDGSSNAYDFRVGVRLNSQSVSGNSSNITVTHALRGWNFEQFSSPTSQVYTDGTLRNTTTVTENFSSTNFTTWASWTGNISHTSSGTKSVSLLGRFRHNTTGTGWGWIPADNDLYRTQSLPAISAPHATPGSISVGTPTYFSNLSVSWSSVSTASTYRLEYQLDGGSWNVDISSTSSTSRTVASSRFDNATTIRFRVRANGVNQYTDSGWRYSSTLTIQKVDQIHIAPTNLQNTEPIHSEEITYSWDAVNNAGNGYEFRFFINDTISYSTTTPNTQITLPGTYVQGGNVVKGSVRTLASSTFHYNYHASTHNFTGNEPVNAKNVQLSEPTNPLLEGLIYLDNGFASWTSVDNDFGGYWIKVYINNTLGLEKRNHNQNTLNIPSDLFVAADSVFFEVAAEENGNAEYFYQKSSFASSSAQVVDKANRPGPENGPILVETTDDSITVSTQGGAHVRLGLYGELFSSPHTFTGLSPNQEYLIYSVYPEDDLFYESYPNTYTSVSTVLLQTPPIEVLYYDNPRHRVGWAISWSPLEIKKSNTTIALDSATTLGKISPDGNVAASSEDHVLQTPISIQGGASYQIRAQDAQQISIAFYSSETVTDNSTLLFYEEVQGDLLVSEAPIGAVSVMYSYKNVEVLYGVRLEQISDELENVVYEIQYDNGQGWSDTISTHQEGIILDSAIFWLTYTKIRVRLRGRVSGNEAYIPGAWKTTDYLDIIKAQRPYNPTFIQQIDKQQQQITVMSNAEVSIDVYDYTGTEIIQSSTIPIEGTPVTFANLSPGKSYYITGYYAETDFYEGTDSISTIAETSPYLGVIRSPQTRYLANYGGKAVYLGSKIISYIDPEF